MNAPHSTKTQYRAPFWIVSGIAHKPEEGHPLPVGPEVTIHAVDASFNHIAKRRVNSSL